MTLRRMGPEALRGWHLVTLSPGHPVTLSPGHLVTLSPGHLVILLLVVGLPGCSRQDTSAQAPSGKQPAAESLGLDRPLQVKVVRPTREHLKRVSTPQPADVEPYEKTDRDA